MQVNQRMNESIVYNPIGYLKCDEKHRFETPRQGVLAQNTGVIELEPNMNFEQAIADLPGFDRIWVIYSFHLNKTWKPKVTPPRSGDKRKVSVLATRSPHRPNSIGMSCVELVKIEGRKIFIKNFDLLEDTPIIDIKPYIPYCDSFPDAKTGWLPQEMPPTHTCTFSDNAIERAECVYNGYNLNLLNFAELQLSNNPTNGERKRLYVIDEEAGLYELGCRTWRIHFTVAADTVHINNITSSYQPSELAPDAEDKYDDKDVHRTFAARFSGE